MPLALYNFRSQIFRSSTKRPRPIFDEFGEPEVSEFNVTEAVDEDVFGLEVAIDDVEGVDEPGIDEDVRMFSMFFGFGVAVDYVEGVDKSEVVWGEFQFGLNP